VTHRVAAIDCGTNSIRLLIADLGPGLTDVTRQMRIVRLGEGVDRTGRLSEAALDRTMTALREYADLIAEAKPEAVKMVATSATRDAANAGEFTDRVIAVLGVAPEVISGDEEAWLSFTGATRELGESFGDSGGRPDGGLGDRARTRETFVRATGPDKIAPFAIRPGPRGHRGVRGVVPPGDNCLPPYLVADIGGGSTEFVLGGLDGDGARGQITDRSVNIGCVRLTERHLHGDPPLAAETEATIRDIAAALDEVTETVPAAKARTLVGLAGSVTTVAAIALGLAEYDSARIHHSRIPAARVQQITGELLAMTRAERAAIPVMHPGRVDVIGAGALILDRIMTRFGFPEVLVSEHDILDGIAWSLLR
jgi:exopolyphosphatase/guanosine-5'-triphosphate,3'-diphosphate pyrophosphatase